MSLLYLSTHVILKLHLIHKRSHFTIRAKQTLCTKRVYFISYQMYHLHLLLWFMIRALVAPPSGMNLLLVNLRLTYTPPTYLHLCFCLTCIQLKTKPTPNPQSPVPPLSLSLTSSGCGSSATTGLLVEVLREQAEHCLNYSKTQLPSAPRSKAEDYQQPAVMRPQ